jgi:hypothetical protein
MEIGAGMINSRLSQPILSNRRHRFYAIGICSSVRRTGRNEAVADRPPATGEKTGENAALKLNMPESPVLSLRAAPHFANFRNFREFFHPRREFPCFRVAHGICPEPASDRAVNVACPYDPLTSELEQARLVVLHLRADHRDVAWRGSDHVILPKPTSIASQNDPRRGERRRDGDRLRCRGGLCRAGAVERTGGSIACARP